MARFPTYLQKDVKRAKQLGVQVKRTKNNNSTYQALRTRGSRRRGRVLLEDNPRPTRLAALRHEVGHHEVRGSRHDQRRLKQAYLATKKAIAGRMRTPGDPMFRWDQKRTRAKWFAGESRSNREEMLAWKNAMRASRHGNLGGDAWRSFDSYAHGVPEHAKRVATLKRYQRLIRRPAFRAQFQKRGSHGVK